MGKFSEGFRTNRENNFGYGNVKLIDDNGNYNQFNNIKGFSYNTSLKYDSYQLFLNNGDIEDGVITFKIKNLEEFGSLYEYITGRTFKFNEKIDNMWVQF